MDNPLLSELRLAYEEHSDSFLRFLERKFSRLQRATLEDLVQVAFAETISKVERSGFEPNAKTSDGRSDWPAYLCFILERRALDYVRQIERRSFDTLSQSHGGSGGEHRAPQQVLLEAERRHQQGLTFSQVLREYCRVREAGGRNRDREIYERSLRGQKPGEIARALGIPESQRNVVDRSLSDSRQWILARTREKDVHESVFLTLHRRKPKERKNVITQNDYAALETLETAGTVFSPPQFNSFSEVLQWVIDLTDALCPSKERRIEFEQRQDADELSDIRYHVIEYGCPLCTTESPFSSWKND